MSYKWPDKDPDEMLDYSVDWSRFLGDDTVSAATWFIKDADGTKEQLSDSKVVDGLQFVQGTISGKVATARFSLGTNNKRYTVTCRITTGEGLQYERSIFLRVKEK
jgi:hypothetical protein